MNGKYSDRIKSVQCLKNKHMMYIVNDCVFYKMFCEHHKHKSYLNCQSMRNSCFSLYHTMFLNNYITDLLALTTVGCHASFFDRFIVIYNPIRLYVVRSFMCLTHTSKSRPVIHGLTYCVNSLALLCHSRTQLCAMHHGYHVVVFR